MGKNIDFESQKEALLKEVRDVLQEVEDLYNSGIENGTDEAKAIKAKAEDKLKKVKSRFSDFESSAADKAREAVDRMRDGVSYTAEKARHAAGRTDEFIQEKPYYAMGFAALAGLVVGVLLNRR